MPAFTIFVEGADTEPEKLPVCVVDGEKYATRICEGMKETEYAMFDFSFEPWTKSDLGKAPAWVVMIEDAKNGVYGEIAAGICNMAERMYLFMGGRQSREKIASGENVEAGNAGTTTQANQDEAPDDSGQPPAAEPSDAAVRLLNVYTNGLADERLEKASSVLESDLTVDEKLWKIDELMPIPPAVSAQKLGDALGVSKTAVQNTTWYDQKRKGRKAEEIDQREGRLRQRGKTYEPDRQPDDDE